MSLDLSALYQIQREEPFATCWMARCHEKLQEYCVNHDINQINIADVCDKITLKYNQSMAIIKDSSNDGENAKEFIPLRIINQLLLGAMRILQKQVDDLLESSENLLGSTKVKKSTMLTTTTCNSRKRKLTTIYEVKQKRRRLSFSNVLPSSEQESQIERMGGITMFDSDDSKATNVHKVVEISVESFQRVTEEELEQFLNFSQDKQNKSPSSLTSEEQSP